MIIMIYVGASYASVQREFSAVPAREDSDNVEPVKRELVQRSPAFNIGCLGRIYKQPFSPSPSCSSHLLDMGTFSCGCFY